jgi:hypothetical protein
LLELTAVVNSFVSGPAIRGIRPVDFQEKVHQALTSVATAEEFHRAVRDVRAPLSSLYFCNIRIAGVLPFVGK